MQNRWSILLLQKIKQKKYKNLIERYRKIGIKEKKLILTFANRGK